MVFGIHDPTQFKSEIQSSFLDLENAIEKANLDPYTYRLYKHFLIRIQCSKREIIKEANKMGLENFLKIYCRNMALNNFFHFK